MMYVAECKQCHCQTIIPHAEPAGPPAYNMVRFYCTQCGKVYELTDLTGLYKAI